VASVAADPSRLAAPLRSGGAPAWAGLGLVAVLVAAGFAGHALVPAASPLLWAMALGVLLAPVAQARPAMAPGVRVAASHGLRLGVALLGLQLSLSELASVGLAGVVIAAATIAATMGATIWLGRRLKVDPKLTLLLAAGCGICGASAIAAMNSVAGARQEDVGYALATITVLGTVAILGLPPAAAALGLGDTQSGMWVGASIHEVAQATAAGAVISAAALKVATLVKLCRVVMLAPVIAIAGSGEGVRMRVPAFVVGFAVLVGVRSITDLPEGLLDGAAVVSTVLLAGGLAALGLGIRPRALWAAGLRPLLLGVAASLVAAATALGLVLLLV
jgi:uncharacterized integral membrane protein (TIGR00698 family)